MMDPCFFGYGSLVNRRTHDYGQARPARVTGWRRAWRKNPVLERCILTVVPGAQDYVEGLIAAVPGADWAALDAREHLYARHDVSHAVRPVVGQVVSDGIGDDPAPGHVRSEVAIYAADPKVFRPPVAADVVLLSYIDVVAQGFLSEFGPEGVDHFFGATEGWEVSVLDDRCAPVYPRHQRLAEEETALVDAALSRLGVRIVAA